MVIDEKEKSTLQEICEKDNTFVNCVLGNVYCSLAMNKRKIECKYLSEELDQNDLKPCTNPKYTSFFQNQDYQPIEKTELN